MQKVDNNSCIRIDRDDKQIIGAKSLLKEHSLFLSKYSSAFSLLGNKVRLSIFLLLKNETSLCVCDLAEILEMKIPAVSQHLRKLKDGGILYSEREGTVLNYSIVDEYLTFTDNILTQELV